MSKYVPLPYTGTYLTPPSGPGTLYFYTDTDPETFIKWLKYDTGTGTVPFIQKIGSLFVTEIH